MTDIKNIYACHKNCILYHPDDDYYHNFMGQK